MTDWYVNGQMQSSVAIDDRAIQYGDGLFETIAIRNNEPRLWRLHIERLARGCQRLDIAMPAEQDLLNGLRIALIESGIDTHCAVAKIIVTAGTSERGYGRGTADNPGVLIRAYPAAPLPPTSYSHGIEVIICETRLATGSPSSGLKTLNRLEQVLARAEVRGTAAAEGLTMDAMSQLVCGTMSNLFFVVNGQVCTPSLELCGVEGVMRRHIIECMQAQGTTIDVRAINESELDTVAEMFIANSQIGVVPVVRCGEYHWPVGTVSRDVMRIVAASGITECQV